MAEVDEAQGPTVLQAKYDRLLGISSRPAAPERQEAA